MTNDLPIIEEIEAIKIIKQVETKGSGPLLVLCNNGNTYFAKTTLPQPPRIELINEVICFYFLKCWGLSPPDIALIQISSDVISQFEKEGNSIGGRYKTRNYENNLLFGSREIVSSVEIDKFINGFKNKSESKLFRRPIDLIKIGSFDRWIANKDRKPGNPNIILSSSGSHFDIHPIDHAAAFGYLSNHLQIAIPKLYLEEEFLILKTPLVQSISTYSDGNTLHRIKSEILEGIQTTLNEMGFIFEQVPPSWGFSKRAKARVEEVLSDSARNEGIASGYFHYLK